MLHATQLIGHAARLLCSLLSTHADKQGVDIWFTVCVCVCTDTDFYAEYKAAIAATNFARRFIGVQGKESQNCCELFSPSSPKSDESARGRCKNYHCNIRVDVGSACVDIRQSPSLTKVLVLYSFKTS